MFNGKVLFELFSQHLVYQVGMKGLCTWGGKDAVCWDSMGLMLA